MCVGGRGIVATETAVKLAPLGDRVVVQPASREETTKSGLVIPDTAKEKPQRGTIVAVGAGRKDDDGDRIAMDVEVGDTVLFAKYAGTEFKYEDQDYLILSEKDILAKIAD
ncbi:MAG: co-chaperone GroES [Thermomicrobiales bacterium]|nr:co-chaperone GroES [Chloroflexia bacterium]